MLKNRQALKKYSPGSYHSPHYGYLSVPVQVAFASEVAHNVKLRGIRDIIFVTKGHSCLVLATATAIKLHSLRINVCIIDYKWLLSLSMEPPKQPLWMLDDCICMGRCLEAIIGRTKATWGRTIDTCVVIQKSLEAVDNCPLGKFPETEFISLQDAVNNKEKEYKWMEMN